MIVMIDEYLMGIIYTKRAYIHKAILMWMVPMWLDSQKKTLLPNI